MPYVEVEVDLSEFTDQEIIEEMRLRDLDDEMPDNKKLLNQLFEDTRNGRDATPVIRELVWQTIGRIF